MSYRRSAGSTQTPPMQPLLRLQNQQLYNQLRRQALGKTDLGARTRQTLA
ncbi:hypothetical protein [Chroococcidiopsis sp. TS-821]|nr:hypothetical protein [Chroococcidiopsis sp. TS-821]